MLMLEDQKEEAACLHVLGLLDPAESGRVEQLAATDPTVARVIRDLTETLTNLTNATTTIKLPSADLKFRVLDEIDAIPARVTTDSEGRITGMNPAFTTLCGYRFPEVVGRKPGHFLQGPLSDPAAVRGLRNAVSQGIPWTTELVNYHKDGSPYWVKISIEPLRDEVGSLTGFLAEERKSDLPPEIAALTAS